MIYRCGRAIIGGLAREAPGGAPLRLTTTTRGLAVPVNKALPAPVPVSGTDAFVGLAFDTTRADGPIRLEEIILDGQLGTALCGAQPMQMAIWDVTTPSAPFLVSNARLLGATSARNRRTRFPAEVILAPGRSFRLVAIVTAWRPTAISAPVIEGPVTVLGALSFRDLAPCSGSEVALAPINATWTALALRFRAAVAVGVNPVGNTLRVNHAAPGAAALSWSTGASGFEVRRCNASTGPCMPAPHAVLETAAWTDPTPTAEERHVWYLVNAVSPCAFEAIRGALPAEP